MENIIKRIFCTLCCLFSIKCYSSQSGVDKTFVLESNYDRTIKKLAPIVNSHLNRTFNHPDIQRNPEQYVQNTRNQHNQKEVIQLGTNILRDYLRDETDYENVLKRKAQQIYNSFAEDEERDQIYDLSPVQRGKEKNFQKTLEAEVKPSYKLRFRNRWYRGEARWQFENNIINAELDARLLVREKIRARLYTKKIAITDSGIGFFGNIQYNSGVNLLGSELIFTSNKNWAVILGHYDNLTTSLSEERLSFQLNTNF
jgi:hypothetical protein